MAPLKDDAHDEHLENALPSFQTLDVALEPLIQHAVATKTMRSEGTARRFFADARPITESHVSNLAAARSHELLVKAHKAELVTRQLRTELSELQASRAEALKLAGQLLVELRLLRDAVKTIALTDITELERQLEWLSD